MASIAENRFPRRGDYDYEWEPLERREPDFYDELDIDGQLSLQAITSPQLIEMFAAGQADLGRPAEIGTGAAAVRDAVVETLSRPTPNLPRPRVTLRAVAFETFGASDQAVPHYEHVGIYMDWLSVIDPEVAKLDGAAYHWVKPDEAEAAETGSSDVYFSPSPVDLENMLRAVVREGRHLSRAEKNRRQRR